MADSTSTTTRRDILGAISVLPAAGLATSAMASMPAVAAGATPILELYRQHQALHDDINARYGDNAPAEVEALFCRRIDAIEGEMMALPCTGAGDFAAKAIIATSCGSLAPDWETGTLWQEARSLTGGAA